MFEFSNVVKVLDYKDDLDLFHQIQKIIDYKVGKVRQCTRVKELKFMDNQKVLVYLEPDFNVVEVHFFNGTERVDFEDAPSINRFMTMEQIAFINQSGEIKIERATYSVEEVKYCIDSVGISYVEIYLSKESEEEE